MEFVLPLIGLTLNFNLVFISVDKNTLITPSVSWSACFPWAYPILSHLQLLITISHWCSHLSSFLILREALFHFLKELLFGNCTKPPSDTYECTWMTRSWNSAGSRIPHARREDLPREVWLCLGLCSVPRVSVAVLWPLAGPTEIQETGVAL